MPEAIAFQERKKGQREGARIALVETVTCIACGKWRPMSGRTKRLADRPAVLSRIASTGH